MDLILDYSCRFDTGIYHYVNGCYNFDSYLPAERVCRCSGVTSAGRKSFHRNGHYPRGLMTFIKARLSKVTILNLRWRCPLCGATFSISPPNVIYRQRVCIYVIFLLALMYLESPDGIDRCYPPELDSLRERAQLRNYHRRLRDTAQITQQSIKEAILYRVGPEDYEQLTLSGLSPPEKCHKCQDSQSAQIWESLHLLEASSHFLSTPVSLLLSRARERATLNGRPFLTQIR